MKEVKSITGETFEITESEIKIKSLDYSIPQPHPFKSDNIKKSQLTEINIENSSVELKTNNDDLVHFWLNNYPSKSRSEIIRELNKIITNRNNIELWNKLKEIKAISLLTELATQGPVPLSNEKIDSEQYRLLRSFNYITETLYRGNKGYYTATLRGFDFYQEMKGF